MGVVSIPLPQRVPQNVPGDFYVEVGLCTQCCIVHGEAPDLLNDPAQRFDECFFRRQPQTHEEVERAITAMSLSEMEALRYGGTDPEIVAMLLARGCARLCDHTPEGVAARRTRFPRIVGRRGFWQWLFGR